MVKKLIETLDKVNDLVGIQMDLTKAIKPGLKFSRKLSVAMGAGFLVVGIIYSSKILLSLGALSAINVLVTTHEIKKF